MQIEQLTERQVELLQTMWEIDEFEDVEEFISTLDVEEQNECRNLIRLVILEGFDEMMANQTSFPEANAVLDKFRI
jgi:hypothetical protein